MDNPVRTARYREIINTRRSNLGEFVRQKLPAESGLDLEVGCGHGHFLTAYAQIHPTHLCIGVDIESSRIERACRKRDRAGLANLHFVHGDARLFLEVLPAGVKLETIFLLFPDPWPKLRHQKHRIMQPEFLAQVATRAGDSCRLCFRTDFEPYYADTEKVLAGHPDWEVTDDSWPFEHETVFQNRASVYFSIIARLKRR